MSMEDAALDLKGQFGGDAGIYNIWYGNRFGTDVLVVECISDDDKARLKSIMPNTFKNFLVHFTSPIWGIGNLLPTYREKIKLLVDMGGNYFATGTKENEHLLALYEEARKKEQEYWTSLSGEQRKKYLADFIKEKREKKPSFANCGDKFLKSE